MRYLVEPTRTNALKTGDLVRASSGNTFVKRVAHAPDPHVVIYYQTNPHTEPVGVIHRQDEIIDRVVEPIDARTLILTEGGVEALADRLLDINRAINIIIRLAADSGIDLFPER